MIAYAKLSPSQCTLMWAMRGSVSQRRQPLAAEPLPLSRLHSAECSTGCGGLAVGTASASRLWALWVGIADAKTPVPVQAEVDDASQSPCR